VERARAGRTEGKKAEDAEPVIDTDGEEETGGSALARSAAAAEEAAVARRLAWLRRIARDSGEGEGEGKGETRPPGWRISDGLSDALLRPTTEARSPDGGRELEAE
jgi:hypothetical protein